MFILPGQFNMNIRLSHKIRLVALVCICLLWNTLQAQDSPERIMLNLTENPTTGMAVTWRTSSASASQMIQYAKATPWTGFTEHLDSVMAGPDEFITDEGDHVFHYSAVIGGLEPGTPYVYRVGEPSAWSEWNQFRTAEAGVHPFSFVWFGDPQNDLRDHCSRVFREAVLSDPGAAFWLFSGDVVSEPEERYYRELFEAGGWMFRSLPMVMAPGNHDRDYQVENGAFVLNERGRKERKDEVAVAWKKHYTLPENGLAGLEETSFWFDYSNTRFVLLNSNYMLEEQAVWLEELLKENPMKWTVLAFHHPFYSGGRGRDDDDSRRAFQQVVDRYHVDLVLTGHDHTYARSHKLVGDQAVGWDQPGTVYALSVSGPKQYEVTSPYPHLMARTGGNMQLYQVIRIDGDSLVYEAFTAEGDLFDRFSLVK